MSRTIKQTIDEIDNRCNWFLSGIDKNAEKLDKVPVIGFVETILALNANLVVRVRELEATINPSYYEKK